MLMGLWYHILAVMEQVSRRLCIKSLFVLATNYKVRCLNYPFGYLLAFDVYQGSKGQNTDCKDMCGVGCIGLNCIGVDPVGSLRRWSKTERKIVDIPAPAVVLQHNSLIGGTDAMDHAFSYN